MSQDDDPRDLERKIEQTSRIASRINDQTTYQRLMEFADGLSQKLQQIMRARRLKEKIRARAREIWEQQGRPAGRDVEFWLQAEAELRDRESE
jgi:hypothetical protein